MSSLVMQAWHQYTEKLRLADDAARQTPRLPDALGLYLSEITGCPRKASLRLLKYPAAAPSAQRVQYFEIGLRAEEKLAVVLESLGWQLARQVPIQTQYGNGRIDILVTQPQRLIIEVKSAALDSLNYLPRSEHVDQTLLYMGFYDSSCPAELVYILRSSANAQREQITAFAIAWDEARFQHLLRKADLICGHVKSGIPVPLELCDGVHPQRVPCAYAPTERCAYWQHCWGTAASTEEWVEI